jgi:putative transposase
MIACVDRLKGFSHAINTVFPQTQIIVLMVRNSMKYLPWRDYKFIATDLKRIYPPVTEDKAAYSFPLINTSTSVT